jgi:sugar phosphate isomerase/epimerase
LNQPTRLFTRRNFLAGTGAVAAGSLLWPDAISSFAVVVDARPSIPFPTQPRERISVASYPFRDFIIGPGSTSTSPAGKMPFEDFAAHVVAKFNVNKIEPWSPHFPSTEPAYLDRFNSALEKAHVSVVDIAVDGRHSPYSNDPSEREQAVAFGKRWIDVAVSVNSPSVRTHIPRAHDSKPDVGRAADSLRQVAEYGASKNIVVNLENDDPVSEDAFFIAQIIDRVGSPWLRALPDFANSLTALDEGRAYAAIDEMFARAYGICHIKALENDDNGKIFRTDMPRTFAILKKHNYKGYCSMEFDSPGDPYQGTVDLISQTLHFLSS